MFTGLIEDVGVIEGKSPRGPSTRLTIGTKLSPLVLGESIAVHGVCLTVDRFSSGRFEADCTVETLARTKLGSLASGSRVHLERALMPESRLGGHFVSGHVDGTATLTSRSMAGDAIAMTFRLEPALSRYVAEKGSIAIDGVSLTVNAVRGDDFDLMLIPHTLGHTTLGDLRESDVVNVETDLLARYVARLLGIDGNQGSRNDHDKAERDRHLLASLRGAGYLG